MNYHCKLFIFLLFCFLPNVFLTTFENFLKSQKCEFQSLFFFYFLKKLNFFKGNISLSCENLTVDEIYVLFSKLNSTQFTENLEVLSVKNSQLSTIVNLPKLNSLK